VSPEDVAEVARKYLVSENRTVGFITKGDSMMKDSGYLFLSLLQLLHRLCRPSLPDDDLSP
jgi:hypothetical protein